jgi:uncharacterized membrane protein
MRCADYRRSARPIRHPDHIANIVFSICAGLASLLVSVLAAVKGAPAVAVVFGLLFVGFLLRAREGQRRRGR